MRLCIFLLVLAAVYFFTDVLYEQAGALMQYFEASRGKCTLLLFVAVFALLLAIPFVPGMELDLAIMMVFGWQSVPLVFAGSLGACSLSYLGGCRFPAKPPLVPSSLLILELVGVRRFQPPRLLPRLWSTFYNFGVDII